MSHRPIEQKKRRRVSKALRRTSLPAYFDLVKWLVEHDHAKTKREAHAIILAKRVKANSHTLGVHRVPVRTPLDAVEEQDMVFPDVEVAARPDLVVSSA